jgi:hypothetical protein
MSDQLPKTEDWNIRKFPLSLKRKCQGLAKEEKKTDPQWVAEKLCAALGFSREIYIDTVYKSAPVIDSPNESGKEKVRPDSQQTNSSGTGKTIRGKTRKKS